MERMLEPTSYKIIAECRQRHGAGNLPAYGLEVPPGDYVVGTVREYDHFVEEAKPVVD